MKKLIKSRRGVAIEMAIGVMFAMIAFTILLLSTAGLQNSQRKADYKEFNQMIEINNIGEHVCKNYDTYNDIAEAQEIVIEGENTGYKVVFSDNKYIIYEGDDTTTPVLTIEISGDKITSWK